MHVLVLPSWYPSAAAPSAGGFVRDQIEALALVRPQWPISVAHWGHHDGALSLRAPAASARALSWRLQARASVRPGPAPSVQEILVPRLSWSLAWRGGGVAGQLRAARQALRRVEAARGPVQLMHAHVGFPAGFIAAELSRERGLPLLVSEHMGPFPFPALADAQGGPVPALRQAFEAAAAVVAVSPALQAHLHRLGLRCDAVVPNVSDERRFALHEAPVPRRHWLTVAHLTHNKGVDLLLRALAEHGPRAAGVHLRVGGEGPARPALQALASQLGVAERVQWLGALTPEQVAQALQRADGFALASRHESFGVVLVEALMAGLPVLATRCGGPEGIVGVADGRLVPVDDVPALAAGLLAEYDEDARGRRERAVQRFGRQAVGEQLAQWCEHLVGAAG